MRAQIKFGTGFIMDLNMLNLGEVRKDLMIMFPTTTSFRLYNKNDNEDCGVSSTLTADESSGVDITGDMSIDFMANMDVNGDTTNLNYYFVELIKGD